MLCDDDTLRKRREGRGEEGEGGEGREARARERKHNKVFSRQLRCRRCSHFPGRVGRSYIAFSNPFGFFVICNEGGASSLKHISVCLLDV